MRHHRVPTNGIELHVVEEGEGPAVVLCHGFPELWFSWRHQIPALAAAGWRVIAPDLRGYGDSSIPEEVEAYDILTICDDMTGLLDALGEEDAVFVGHDWGAILSWQLAVARPERVRAVAGLSVPFMPRGDRPPIERFREHMGEDFYIVWFQQRGDPEEVLARDVRRTVLITQEIWHPSWADYELPYVRPAWASQDEVEVYVRTFERNGFAGPLNWYRNWDRNWELTEPFSERRVEQPAMYLRGENDPVAMFIPDHHLDEWVPDLRRRTIVPGAAHWVQQERPRVVTAELLEFLGSLRADR